MSMWMILRMAGGAASCSGPELGIAKLYQSVAMKSARPERCLRRPFDGGVAMRSARQAIKRRLGKSTQKKGWPTVIETKQRSRDPLSKRVTPPRPKFAWPGCDV
ncbi:MULTISPECIES: hypothetical protein [unclassified Bradyrhizobium]|uniref:hypothetical protein n=1 Tax=unclassified Bradyrhizobium TaxID=2631580 RepID=UPI002916B14E|nr:MULTISPECIES: hypothetical protein [unclassified Bradyrhizobium]